MKTHPVEKLNSGSVMACSPVLLAGPDQNARRGVACDSPSFHCRAIGHAGSPVDLPNHVVTF